MVFEIADPRHIVHQGGAGPGFPPHLGNEGLCLCLLFCFRPARPVAAERIPESFEALRVRCHMNGKIAGGKDLFHQSLQNGFCLLCFPFEISAQTLQHPVIRNPLRGVAEQRRPGKTASRPHQGCRMPGGRQPVLQARFHFRGDILQALPVRQLCGEEHLPHRIQGKGDPIVQDFPEAGKHESDLVTAAVVRVAVHAEADASAAAVDQGRQFRVAVLFGVDISEGILQEGKVGEFLLFQETAVEQDPQIGDPGGEHV